jgi:cytochrome bd ubiquinol oxidase subunit I
MQHPTGYSLGAGGKIVLESYWGLLLNPWIFWMYLHNMIGAVVTGSFVMAGIGAFYLLNRKHEEHGRTFVKVGVICGLIGALLLGFPTGDGQGKNVAAHQPAALAAMEGLFQSESGAPLAILGQPDREKGRLDNPLTVPRLLSFVSYSHWNAHVRGLESFPRDEWPDNMELLYYSFHIMVGLGTIFIAVMALANLLLFRGKLFTTRWMLWIIMLLIPFPYIANTAGWMTAELGRQPWIIYGLMRTADSYSPFVSQGNTLFTLLGFMGIYTVLSILFLFLVMREIQHGPDGKDAPAAVAGH